MKILVTAAKAMADSGVRGQGTFAQDTQFTLTFGALAAGTVMVLTVSARNATGESQPGNAVEMAVP